MNTSTNRTTELAKELKNLLEHPAYKFLQEQCKYYSYVLKQLPHDSSGFQVGGRVFYAVEYLSSTAEDFLDKVLLPKYAEIAAARIAEKSRDDHPNASAIYSALVEMFYNHRDEEFNPKQIYGFYASLEDFAVSLREIRCIGAPRDQQLNFRLYINPETYFQFCAISQHDLMYCFRLLRSVYFCELLNDGYDTMAEKIAEDIIADFAESQNIELSFDLSSYQFNLMVTDCKGISFRQYDSRDIPDLHKLQQDVSVAPKLKLSSHENAPKVRAMMAKFEETKAKLNKFHLNDSK